MSDANNTFPGVVGFDATCQRLGRAIVRDQLHHGLIVVGPRGVGKATLARGLGCALHCEVSPGFGCGVCVSCRRVLAGTHAGVEWIEPEADRGTIKVAAARELANRLEFAPFEGTRHLVVFDPAEAMNEQAYNALLKTIEEPKPGVHFVMLATGLDALLPTILSRCLTVRLGRLRDDEVRTIIGSVLQARAGTDDDPGDVSDERIELAVRLSSGSAGVGVELALDPTLDPALGLLRELAKAADAGPPRIFSGDKGPLWHAWQTAVGPVKTGRPARERAVANRSAELWLLHLREALRGGDGLPGVQAPTDQRMILHQLDRVQALLEGMARNPNVRLALEQTLLEISAG